MAARTPSSAAISSFVDELDKTADSARQNYKTVEFVDRWVHLPRGEHHVHARGNEVPGGRFPDAATGAGDDGGGVVDVLS